jgi:hypothetical protein
MVCSGALLGALDAVLGSGRPVPDEPP